MLKTLSITPGSDVEIIEGLFYPGEIVTLTGGFNVAKTPLLRDWAFCIATGTPWCGRKVVQRPVLLLAHESTERKVVPDWERLSAYKRVPPPAIPEQFQIYMEAGSLDTPANEEILNVLAKPLAERMEWLRAKVLQYPTSVVMIDPFDMFFRVQKNKSEHILYVYNWIRMLRKHAPLVSFVMAFNMRKRARISGVSAPDLMVDPRGWLEEASGAIEIQSRSDLRLGVDFYGSPEDGIRVFNGAKREDTIEPILLKSIVVGESDTGKPLFAGFEQVDASSLDTDQLLPPKQHAIWMGLDDQFTFDDLKRQCPSRAAAYRMRERLLRNKLVRQLEEGVFEKL